MSVKTNVDDVVMSIDDTNVNYNKVGTYNVRFLARSPMRNKKVSKTMPYTVQDTKGPSISIMPEKTENPADGVAVSITAKDPSDIKGLAKYAWYEDGKEIPGEQSSEWKELLDNHNIVKSKEDGIDIDEGKIRVAVKAEDNQSNKSQKNSQTYVISKHVPTKVTITPGVTEFTNKDIKVAINYENAIVKKYKIGNGPWTNYTEELTITENTTVIAQATNGDKTVYSSLEITNIDKKAPSEVVINPNENSAEVPVADIKINITAKDELAGFSNLNNPVKYQWVAEGSLPAKEWQTLSLNSFENGAKEITGQVINNTLKGKYKLYLKVTDSVGNEVIKESGIYNLYNYEMKEPTFTVEPTADWVKDKVTVTINKNPSEPEEEIYYSFDKTENTTTWQKYSNPLEINENKTLYAYAKSKAGKTSVIAECVINKIDKEAPSLEFAQVEMPVKNIKVKFNTEDLKSGIKTINYAWVDESINSEEKVEKWNALNSLETRELPVYNNEGKTGNKKLFIKVEDNVLNKTVMSKTYTFDNTVPTIEITSNKTICKSILPEFNVRDNSGKVKYEYAWTEVGAIKDNIIFIDPEKEPLKEHGQGLNKEEKFWIKATDSVGNTHIESKVFTFDNLKPELNIITETGKDIYYSKVLVRFNISTPREELESIKYKWTEISEINVPQDAEAIRSVELTGIPSYENNKTTGSKKVWIIATDKAGNQAVESKIINFDFDLPNVVFNTNNKEIRQKVQVNIITNDEHSGVKSVGYKWTMPRDESGEELEFIPMTGNLVPEYGLGENGTRDLWIRVEDKVGNYVIKKERYIFDNIGPDVRINSEGKEVYKSTEVTVAVQDDKGNFKTYYAWTNENTNPTDEDFILYEGDKLPAYGEGITGNKKLTIKAVDNIGNTTIRNELFYFDNTEPTFVLEVDEKVPVKSIVPKFLATDNDDVDKIEYAWTDAKIEVEPDSSKMKSVTVKDTQFESYNNNGKSGKQKLWVKVTDRAGNVKHVSYIFTFDNTKPELSLVDGILEDNKVYKSVIPEIKYSDNKEFDSGIKVVGYTWEDVSKTPEDFSKLKYTPLKTNETVLPKFGTTVTGERKLFIGARDNAGNYNLIVKTVKFDNIFPVITLDTSNRMPYKTLTPEVVVTDQGSSKIDTYFAWTTKDELPNYKKYTDVSELKYGENQNGERIIHIKAIDEAGNETTFEKEYNFDNEAPVVNIINSKETTYRYLNTEFTAVDKYNIKSIEYAIVDGNDTVNEPKKYTLLENSTDRVLPTYLHTKANVNQVTVWIKAKDELDNTSITKEVFNVTNKRETFDITTDDTKYKQSVEVEFVTKDKKPEGVITYAWVDSSIDNVENVQSWQTLEDNTLRKLPVYDNNGQDGEKRIWIKLKDNVNSGVATKVFKFDHTKPVVTVTPDEKLDKHYKELICTVNIEENTGKIAKKEYAWSKDENKNDPNAIYTNLTEENKTGLHKGFSGERYLIVRVEDEAGNVTIVKPKYLFDNTKPVIKLISPEQTNVYKSVSPEVEITDAIGTIVKTEYSWTGSPNNGPEYKEYKGKIPTMEGVTEKKVLWLRATDKAGNEGELKLIYTIDNTPPEIKVLPVILNTGKVGINVEVSDWGVNIEDLTNATYTFGEVSGKQSAPQSLPKDGYIEKENLKYNTEYKFVISYTDKAGNAAVKEYVFKTRDILMPTITTSVPTNTWTNKNVVTIDYKEYKDDLFCYIDFGDKEEVLQQQPIILGKHIVNYDVVNNNTVISAVVKDRYGNVVRTEKIKFDHVDSTKPEVQIKSKNVLYTTANFEVISNKIGVSGFKQFEYRYYKEGTEAPKEFTATVDENIEIYDLVPNTAYIFEVKAVNNAGYESNVVSEKIVTLKDDLLGEPNAPVLTKGMIPVKHNGKNWVICSETDPEWYNYKSRNWANIMLADGVYKNKFAIGQEIQEEELGSMFVWIPRYAYSINKYLKEAEGEGKSQEITSVTFLEDNTNNERNGQANIPKVKKTSGTSGQPTEKIVHPAFTFGTEEIEGYWVAKYEAVKTAENDIKISKAGSKFNSINIGNALTQCMNIRTNTKYGLDQEDVDVHLIKNSEWGGMSYLTASKYGVTPTNIGSTTGNITGIYEINGGRNEFVAGYYDNKNDNLKLNGTTEYFQNDNLLKEINSKYWDKYKVSQDEIDSKNIWNEDFNSNGKRKTITHGRFNSIDKNTGTELVEITTAGGYSHYLKNKSGKYIWSKDGETEEHYPGLYNGDIVLLGHCNLPFITRGGSSNDKNDESGMFTHKEVTGEANSLTGFRPVIRVVKRPPLPNIEVKVTEKENRLDGVDFILEAKNISKYGLDKYKYKVYENNALEPQEYTNHTSNNLTINGLKQNTQYILKVIAVDNDYRESAEVTYNFKTISEVKANKPKISNGMIPIKYNGTDWVMCEANDPQWYDYDQMKYANVMLSDGTFKAGDAANIGKVVQTQDLGSMFVWVPRFAYSINKFKTPAEGEGTQQNLTDVTFLEGNTNVGIENKVRISYPKSYSKEYALTIQKGAKTPKIVHPAFTMGNKELSGMWVAKFEASSKGMTTNNWFNNDSPNYPVTILPNAETWRHLGVGNAFRACRKMKDNADYKLPTNADTHLMKNTEWGAVSYLAASNYGQTPIVNKTRKETGIFNLGSIYFEMWSGGGDTPGAYKNNTNQTTTGNITGIYDMAGGAWEFVAGYYDNGGPMINKYLSEFARNESGRYRIIDEKYWDKYQTGPLEEAGIASDLWNNSSIFTNVVNNQNKERIAITEERYKLMEGRLGDATWEISEDYSYITKDGNGEGSYSWKDRKTGSKNEYGRTYYNKDMFLLGHTNHNFITRGGSSLNTPGDGIFAFSTGLGKFNNSLGFRPVIHLEEAVKAVKPEIVGNLVNITQNSAEYNVNINNLQGKQLKEYQYNCYEANVAKLDDTYKVSNGNIKLDTLKQNTTYILDVKAVATDGTEITTAKYKFTTNGI